MIPVLAAVTSYLIGSVPVGYIIARMKGLDIRQYGSGNIGTTNVWRNLGPVPGLITFWGDTAKGFLAVWLGVSTGTANMDIICGLAAIAGHSWPVFLRFKGGKVIATSLGVLIGISYQVALLGLAVWVVVVGVSRYVSLGSVLAAVSVPVWMYWLHLEMPYIAFGVLAAAFAVYRHRSNIKRLLNGTEYKIGSGKRS